MSLVTFVCLLAFVAAGLFSVKGCSMFLRSKHGYFGDVTCMFYERQRWNRVFHTGEDQWGGTVTLYYFYLSLHVHPFLLLVSVCWCWRCCLQDQVVASRVRMLPPASGYCLQRSGCCLQGPVVASRSGCYGDSVRIMSKQRVMHTVMFHAQATQNNSDSLCLSKNMLLVINALPASIRQLKAQEAVKMPQQGC